jgi:hypothetical protein
MNKRELNQAQLLHGIYYDAFNVAEARDPKQRRKDDVAPTPAPRSDGSLRMPSSR